MRASTAKLALGVAAWIALGAAAFVIVRSEQQLTVRRTAVRSLDVVAREASAALSSVKSAQQGYVAPGQGLGAWMARVDELLKNATAGIKESQQLAATDDGRAKLAEAVETLEDLRAIDKRARQYLNGNQALMAADVIFSEGGETAGIASRQVEAARHAEFAALDVHEADSRRLQAYTAIGAVAMSVLAMLGLILWPSRREPVVDSATLRSAMEDARDAREALTLGDSWEPSAPMAVAGGSSRTVNGPLYQSDDRGDSQDDGALAATASLAGAEQTSASAARRDGLDSSDGESDRETVPREMLPVRPPMPVILSDLPRETIPVLTATASLCVELNRVRNIEELTLLLERAAEVLDASGLVVWVGMPGASSLRPVLAHGYSPQALARMPHVPRTGDNAAAAAFRTGKLQIVLTRPGVSSGALAAPMMTPAGCIGALTAEIKNGGEASDGVQALIAIVTSQLASVLADSVLQSEELEDDALISRIASA